MFENTLYFLQDDMECTLQNTHLLSKISVRNIPKHSTIYNLLYAKIAYEILIIIQSIKIGFLDGIQYHKETTLLIYSRLI